MHAVAAADSKLLQIHLQLKVGKSRQVLGSALAVLHILLIHILSIVRVACPCRPIASSDACVDCNQSARDQLPIQHGS